MFKHFRINETIGDLCYRTGHRDRIIFCYVDVDLAGDSLLIVSLPPDTLGTVAVSWQNIGGADLTEGSTLNAIGIEIVFDDLPADLIVNVTDGSSNTGQSTLATATLVSWLCLRSRTCLKKTEPASNTRGARPSPLRGWVDR